MQPPVSTPEEDDGRIVITRRNFVKGAIGVTGVAMGILGARKLWKDSQRETPVQKDPVTRYLEETPELSYGFSKKDYEWGRNYIEDYGKEFFVSHPEFHETFNSKIKQERLILEEKLDQNHSDVADLIGKNWDYHYKLWKDGKSLLPLDKPSMERDFPGRGKKVIYRGMWMDKQVAMTDALTGKTNKIKSVHTPKMEVLENNLEVIFNGTLYKRVMDAYEKPNSKRHRRAWFLYYLGWEPQKGYEGQGWYEKSWPNSSKMFEKYDELFAKDERLNKLRFLRGYVASLDEFTEQASYYGMIPYSKALGDHLSIVSADYPGMDKIRSEKIFNYWHDDTIFHVPDYIIQELKSNPSKYGKPLIGKGQGIGFLFAEEEAIRKDGSDYVKQQLPSGEMIILFRND